MIELIYPDDVDFVFFNEQAAKKCEVCFMIYFKN